MVSFLVFFLPMVIAASAILFSKNTSNSLNSLNK
jgi:hypothetical protein